MNDVIESGTPFGQYVTTQYKMWLYELPATYKRNAKHGIGCEPYTYGKEYKVYWQELDGEQIKLLIKNLPEAHKLIMDGYTVFIECRNGIPHGVIFSTKKK